MLLGAWPRLVMYAPPGAWVERRGLRYPVRVCTLCCFSHFAPLHAELPGCELCVSKFQSPLCKASASQALHACPSHARAKTRLPCFTASIPHTLVHNPGAMGRLAILHSLVLLHTGSHSPLSLVHRRAVSGPGAFTIHSPVHKAYALPGSHISQSNLLVQSTWLPSLHTCCKAWACCPGPPDCSPVRIPSSKACALRVSCQCLAELPNQAPSGVQAPGAVASRWRCSPISSPPRGISLVQGAESWQAPMGQAPP